VHQELYNAFNIDLSVLVIETDNNHENEVKPGKHTFSFSSLPSCAASYPDDSGKLVYHATKFSKATLVLIDVLPYTHLSGVGCYNYRGSPVYVEYIPTVEGTAVYYMVDQVMVFTNKHLMAAITRAFTATYAGYHNDWLSLESVFGDIQALTSIQSKNADLSAEWLDQLTVSKISGEHHVHFDATEVYECLTETGRGRAGQVTRLGGDLTTTFVAGVMLWLASLGDEMYQYVINSSLLDAADMQTFKKLGKLISVRAKSLQNILPVDLKPIFEVDVLVNRVMGSVDWETEKRNRTQPSLARVTYEDVFNHASALFSRPDATRKKPTKMEFKDFWATRWQWSASGSIHSQYEKDMAFVSKDRVLKNKFISLISMPESEFDEWYQRDSELVGWSSTKYEWGKQRAIYGTDLTSYVLSHFAFYNCESVLPSEFPVGSKANASYVAGSVKSIIEGATPLCIDFEDFNSQHSVPAMRAVIDAYVKTYASGLSQDQIRACRWTSESLENMYVRDLSGTQTTYRAKGTLLSGWRLTTFMNSVLNSVYISIMNKKHRSSTIRSIHNGDDVFSGITNLLKLTSMLEVASDHNIRIQPAKCALGGMAEFLRVDHLSRENGQYMTRGIATLLHGRIESGIAVSPRDLVEATEARLRESNARGVNARVLYAMRKLYYTRIAKLYDMTMNDMFVIKKTHRICGGVESRLDADIDNLITYHSTPPAEVEVPNMPGVASFASHLAAELEIVDKVDQVAKGIYEATMKTLALSRKAATITKNPTLEKTKIWRALTGSYKHLINQSNLGKSRLAGFTIDILAKDSRHTLLYDYIRKWQDPLKALQIVTR
jgi:hypothetical protein